ncbi:MAG: helix-turn-helix domain-containing protein [Ruminiclostridium sp.]|nr:helix-turn-helix domain-containing protein [Ruminiclostridium sp.]
MIKRLFTDIINSLDFRFKVNILTLNGDFYIHSHEFCELLFVLGGSAVHVVDGCEYILKPGDVFTILGDVSHGFKNMKEFTFGNILYDQQEMLALTSELRKLAGFQSMFVLESYYNSEHGYKYRLQLNSIQLNYIKEVLTLMHDEYNGSRDGYKAVLLAYFQSLIAYVSRCYTEENNNNYESVFRLAESIAYIENNYKQPIKIDDLARIAYMSTRHFTRIFYKYHHTTPGKYIIQLRFQNAVKLLQDSRLSITQVAIESGFSDISFFSRQFKKKTGFTPKDFRNILFSK